MAKTLKIRGVIVPRDDAWFYDMLEMEHTSITHVEDFMAGIQNGEPITVQISSGGGDVWTGSDIYSALKNHLGHVTIEIQSLCASIATVIASAGDTVRMSPVGQYMIHGASMVAYGNKNDMADSAEFLAKVDKTLRNAYLLKARNVTDEQLSEWMEKDTWFTAQEALEYGFIDEIMHDEERVLASPEEYRVAAYTGGLIPSDKIRAFKQKKSESMLQNYENGKILEAKLKLLTLGGYDE